MTKAAMAAEPIDDKIAAKKAELADAETGYGLAKQRIGQAVRITRHEPHTTQIYVKADGFVLWIPKKDVPNYSPGSVPKALREKVEAEVARQWADNVEHRFREAVALRRELVDLEEEKLRNGSD